MVRGDGSGTAGERVQLIDYERPSRNDDSVHLLRIVCEALILQDEAEEVLAAVSRHEHLGVVARRGGPVGRRFLALQDQLPASYDEAQLDHLRDAVHTILYHHAMQVATALEFLAVAGRSERLHRRVSDWGTLGAPARRLEEIYAELMVRPGPLEAGGNTCTRRGRPA